MPLNNLLVEKRKGASVPTMETAVFMFWVFRLIRLQYWPDFHIPQRIVKPRIRFCERNSRVEALGSNEVKRGDQFGLRVDANLCEISFGTAYDHASHLQRIGDHQPPLRHL